MSKATIIAEIGCNHGGSLKEAEKMIAIAATYVGADIVKFQKRTIVDLLSDEEYNRPYIGMHSFGETYGQHREALEFSIEQHQRLQYVCNAHKVEYSTSVWDMNAAQEVVKVLDPLIIKIPSACNMDFEMIQWLIDNSKCAIHLSMGMTTKKEKDAIWHMFAPHKDRFVVYHCTSAYPVPFDNVYLQDLSHYQMWTGSVGLSGHHLGIAIDIAAYQMGVRWIERHFTLDRTAKGTDHAASLEPDGLRKLVRDLDAVDQANKASDMGLKDIEKGAREKLKRCV